LFKSKYGLEFLSQEKRLKELQDQFEVIISIDKRTGITIQGHMESVSSACQAIFQVISDQKSREIKNLQLEIFAKQVIEIGVDSFT